MTPRRHAVEELDQLLAAGVTSEDAPELARLARLATAVRDSAVVPAPDPAFTARLRAELLVAEREVGALDRVREVAGQASRMASRSLRAAVAAAAAASLVGTAGVAAAAEAALPGDALYGLKTAVESARLALSDAGVGDGRLRLQFASQRLDELAAGADRLDDDTLVDLLRTMDDAGIVGAEELLTAAAATPDGAATVQLVIDFATSQSDRLLAVSRTLPPSVNPFVADSLEVLRRIRLQAEAVLAPPCDCDESRPAVAGLPPARGLVPFPTVTVPTIEIARPGEGPAVTVPTCACTAPTVAPTPLPTPRPTGGEPEPTTPPPSPRPAGTPSDPSSPADPPPSTPPTDPGTETEPAVLPELDLPSPLDEVASEIDELVDELLPDEVQEPLDEVLDPVVEPAEDIVEDVLSELPLP